MIDRQFWADLDNDPMGEPEGEWFLPVFCDVCGKTMPRGIADDSSLHSCAKEEKS